MSSNISRTLIILRARYQLLAHANQALAHANSAEWKCLFVQHLSARETSLACANFTSFQPFVDFFPPS
jgi:hypothetical protein